MTEITRRGVSVDERSERAALIPLSDVDLLVIVSDSTQPPHRRAQEAYRCVGAVGLPKDLLVLTREEFGRQAQIVSSLARRVKATGKVLYERAEAHRSTALAHQEPA